MSVYTCVNCPLLNKWISLQTFYLQYKSLCELKAEAWLINSLTPSGCGWKEPKHLDKTEQYFLCLHQRFSKWGEAEVKKGRNNLWSETCLQEIMSKHLQYRAMFGLHVSGCSCSTNLWARLSIKTVKREKQQSSFKDPQLASALLMLFGHLCTNLMIGVISVTKMAAVTVGLRATCWVRANGDLIEGLIHLLS